MRVIAHRGLLYGPDHKLENSPKQIMETLNKGFDVEVDVWFIDNDWWLGHDNPDYLTRLEFLNMEGLWIHCKNAESLFELNRRPRTDGKNFNYFWHQNDDFTITSNGFIWTYPGKPLYKRSIEVLPESGVKLWYEDYRKKTHYGVCTDYPVKI
jgi:hypothetical protein